MDEPGQSKLTNTVPPTATAVAVGLGSAVALQARINGELGQRIGDGVIAALLSNTGGLLLLSGLVATRPRMRRGLRRVRTAVRDRTLRPYHLLGGVCGAFLVAGTAGDAASGPGQLRGRHPRAGTVTALPGRRA